MGTVIVFEALVFRTSRITTWALWSPTESVGVPLTTPVSVSRDRPAGIPEVAQVYGPMPPVPASLAAYG